MLGSNITLTVDCRTLNVHASIILHSDHCASNLSSPSETFVHLESRFGCCYYNSYIKVQEFTVHCDHASFHFVIATDHTDNGLFTTSKYLLACQTASEGINEVICTIFKIK